MQALLPIGRSAGTFGRRSTLLGYFATGAQDLTCGAWEWRLWYLIGPGDMRRRFARARLGQLWIMLSSALLVSTTGLVWAFLWKQPMRDMLPFIAVSMMVWQLIVGILNESATALPSNSQYFLNQYIPASTILYSVLYRNGVAFALNMVIPFAVSVAFGIPLTPYAILSLLGLALLVISCFSAAYIIAILCTRFRDIVQVVASVLQGGLFHHADYLEA